MSDYWMKLIQSARYTDDDWYIFYIINNDDINRWLGVYLIIN